MIAARAGGPAPAASAPKLLLDTNIYRDLADNRLTRYEQRFREIGKRRTPPLFWACEITVEELLAHVRPEKASKFGAIRDALYWMETLCGNLGMTETLPWILRRGVFDPIRPHNHRYSITFNVLRRAVLKAKTFGELNRTLVANIAKRRADHRARVDDWVRVLDLTLDKVQLRVKRSNLDVIDLATKSVLAATRFVATQEGAYWGTLRSVDDQATVQRERIAYEVAQIFKAKNRDGFKPHKHPTDFSDRWLCAYPAAGYTLVTLDNRLQRALKDGRCKNPRVVTLDEGLASAEAWLAANN